MTWNPLEQREAQTFPLECSGGVASATFRPWGARERIAYEDALTSRLVELGIDDAGGEIEAVKLGTMRLLQLALTIVSVEGFPDVCTVENADGSTETVRFDPRDERCLKALDMDTYDELRKHALVVQSQDGAVDDGESTGDAENGAQPAQEAAADADPTLTPPTPRASTTRASRKAPASSAAE